MADGDLAALAALEETADGLVRALTMVGRGGERLAAGDWQRLLALAVDRASLPGGREPFAGAVELDGARRGAGPLGPGGHPGRLRGRRGAGARRWPSRCSASRSARP